MGPGGRRRRGWVSGKVVEGLVQHLVVAGVAAVTQPLLGGGTELGVSQVAGEGGARVLGQDAHQHDAVILDVGARRVLEV